jgi:protein-disulfide isomerase
MQDEPQLTKKEIKALRKEEKLQKRIASQSSINWKKMRLYVGIFAILLLGWWWWKSVQLPIPEIEQNKSVEKIVETDWVLGDPNATIQIVEYSDLQCPACQAYSGTGEYLVEQLGDQIGFAFRHFPLQSIHTNAHIAAQAAEAAGKQGKFWEMVSVLFEEQGQWGQLQNPRSSFVEYAQRLELNVDQFETDLSSKEVRALVEADYLSGLIAKVNATPTFYVNGQKMNNLRGPDDLLARIELTLWEATAAADISQ